MSDETTARDRAIEVVAAKLYSIHGPLSTDEDSAEADGQDVVDALLANPEVLRALAGAPTADDELTKAERWARKYALYAEMAPSSRRMVTLMAEYDERGRERDAARAASTQLAHDLAQSVNAKAGYSRLLRGMARRLWKHRMAFRQIRRAGAAAEHRLGRERDAARAEVQRLRVFDDATRQQLADVLEQNQQLRAELAEAHAVRDRALMKHAEQYAEVERLRRDVVQHEATIRYLVAERERARARDEAAKVAVQWWREIGSGTPTEKRLRELLDALARTHEAEGQDR